jgi:hypothetical protein
LVSEHPGFDAESMARRLVFRLSRDPDPVVARMAETVIAGPLYQPFGIGLRKDPLAFPTRFPDELWMVAVEGGIGTDWLSQPPGVTLEIPRWEQDSDWRWEFFRYSVLHDPFRNMAVAPQPTSLNRLRN